MKRFISILSVILSMILLCSCSNSSIPFSSSQAKQSEGGFDTPEEAATTFVKAVVLGDMSLFASCVHPSMLEDWATSFHINGLYGNEVREIYVTYTHDVSEEDQQELQQDLQDDRGIEVTQGKIVNVYVRFFDQSDDEEYIKEWETGVICVDDRWYAFGWS